ncbi:hypothetical protein GYMLUDRAFT_242904 [Collybiopsis luxurians FD-317 M1]|uniref:Uncharacterized protein n=1 Tax=Collybiopsis luxurians FD-317 M1 TaxID=944289 RepID=A0A0D0C295_9AGAR|nr:hypothetical protein GYMLUDRAFT_242904 [Collybiopsis luxurians FD-317 M1]
MPRSYWPHSSSECGYMAQLVLRLLSTMPCLLDLVIENHFFPAVHTASLFHDVLQRLRVPLPLACILGPRLRVLNLDILGTLLYSPHFPALPQLPSVVTLHVSLQALTAIDCRCLVESFPSVEDVTVSWFDYYERSSVTLLQLLSVWPSVLYFTLILKFIVADGDDRMIAFYRAYVLDNASRFHIRRFTLVDSILWQIQS